MVGVLEVEPAHPVAVLHVEVHRIDAGDDVLRRVQEEVHVARVGPGVELVEFLPVVQRAVELVVAGEVHPVRLGQLPHAVPAFGHELDLLVGDGLHHPVAGGRHDDEVVDLDVLVLLELGLERRHDAVVVLADVDHVVVEDAEDVDEALDAPVLGELLQPSWPSRSAG